MYTIQLSKFHSHFFSSGAVLVTSLVIIFKDMSVCLHMSISTLLSSAISCEQNNFIAKIYTGNNNRKMSCISWHVFSLSTLTYLILHTHTHMHTFVYKYEYLYIHEFETNANRKIILSYILVVAITQPYWKPYFHSGAPGRMKSFRNFLENILNLRVKWLESRAYRIHLSLPLSGSGFVARLISGNCFIFINA